ncbi:MAG: MFS transporter [Spirochaetaceae bacterium]|nr:MAG: MFS transporter [Spirochaetaceae bacterium]
MEINSLKPTRPLVIILLITAAHYFHHQLTALVVPLLPFMRDGFSLTYTQAGGLVSAFALSYGIGQLPAGWLADRIGPRYLLLAGITGVAVAGIMVGLSRSYPALILFLVVMGIMGGGYHPSATPIISMAVPAAQRGRAVGVHLMGGSASHLVAPLLGVAIAGVLGWRGAFLLVAGPILVLGLVVFFVFGRLVPSHRVGAGSRFPAPEETARGRAFSGRIALVVAMTSVIGAFIASVLAFVPLFLVDVLLLSEAHAAFGLALFFSAGLWAAPLGGLAADRFGPMVVFALVALVAGPLILALAVSANPMTAMIVLLVLGAVMFVRMTVSESWLVDAVSPSRRSTVLGVYFFAGMEGSGIITPILGNLIDRFGFRVAFGLAGGITLVALVVLALAGAWFGRGAFLRSRRPGILPNQ